MHFNPEKGILVFEKILTLGPEVTRGGLFGCNDIKWEGWPEKKDNNTVSYRTILKGDKKFGDIYLIIDFWRPNDPDSKISSWRFSPEKLLMGEQKKPEGNVTRNLRHWFKDESSVLLPVYGGWGDVDAAYDPHNRTGTIACNYHKVFKDNKASNNNCT